MEVQVLFKKFQSKMNPLTCPIGPAPFYNPEWAFCSLACRKETRWQDYDSLELGCLLLPSFLHPVLDRSVYCFLFPDSFLTQSSQTLLALFLLFVFKPPVSLLSRRWTLSRCPQLTSLWSDQGRSDTFWSEKLHFRHLQKSVSALRLPEHTLLPCRANHQPRSMNNFFFSLLRRDKSQRKSPRH